MADARLFHMTASVVHLLDEALLLPPADRAALLIALLDSLEGSADAGISEAWRAELRRLRRGLHDGSILPVSWAAAKARLSTL